MNYKKQEPGNIRFLKKLTFRIVGKLIFLHARPTSQTHDCHKGRMISNHESPAGRNKNCGEKSAFNICNFRFECFLLAHHVLKNIGKNSTEKLPNSVAIITSLGKHMFSDMHPCRGVYR